MVNCVEVTVRFQPAPVPVVSTAVSGNVYVGVESPPARLAENVGAADVATLSAPAVTVPVTVGLAVVAALAVWLHPRAAIVRTAAAPAARCFPNIQDLPSLYGA